jgi:hypothetical protein
MGFEFIEWRLSRFFKFNFFKRQIGSYKIGYEVNLAKLKEQLVIFDIQYKPCSI